MSSGSTTGTDAVASMRSCTDAAVALVAGSVSVWMAPRSYASRVAAMFAVMYGASLLGCDGSTWKFWTKAGQTRPSRMEVPTSSEIPTPGSSQLRRHTVTKQSTAQISATPTRMLRAGSTACWSV